MEKNEQNKDEIATAPGVLEKYQEAGKICKNVMALVLEKCVPGASVHEVCSFGDKMIEEQVSKVFNNKKVPKKGEDEKEQKAKQMEKGIGYPTTLSCNELCGLYSPVKSEDSQLKEGDVCKVNLGCHVDGYVAQLGHTVVVGQTEVTGRKADVMMAAWTGLQAAVRMLKPGNTNTQITENFEKCSKSYNCNSIQGALSHEVQRWLMDGNNVIINKETPDQKVNEHELQVNEIYVLDVFASTGEGKPRESELRCDVFKREMDGAYDLKSKHARSFLSEVRRRFSTFGFALRAFDDEIVARTGANECVSKNVVTMYPVLTEKVGEIVAQFQWTVLISNKRVILLTSHLMDESTVKPDGEITDEALKELLSVDLASLSQKKKNAPKK